MARTTDPKLKLIAAVPLFAGFNRREIEALGRLMDEVDVEDGRVLMTLRRWEPRAGTWCLPAGFMESGETPEQTAIRELEEETGLVATLSGLFGVYAGFDDPRVRSILILSTAERSSGTLAPGDDAIETEFFPLDALPEEIAFGSHRRALEEYRSGIRAARR